MKFSKELIKGSTKNLILAVLKDGEMYGYQIIKSIADQSQEALQFGEGSIYPALHEMEKLGLLSSHWVPQEGKPDRKYYKLTPEGSQALAQGVKDWREFSHAVNHVLSLA